jgi:hypothetical protein
MTAESAVEILEGVVDGEIIEVGDALIIDGAKPIADGSSAAASIIVEEDDTLANVAQKGGRKRNPFWDYFTNDVDPQKRKSAICKHCCQQVNHHKKSEQAMIHINSCPPFRKMMNGMEIGERPDWFESKKRRACPLSANQSKSSLSSGKSTLKEYLLPKLSGSSIAKFEEAIAMHYYVTGTSFARIEENNLLAALKVLRPDIELPSRKKLAGPLLEKSFMAVKQKCDVLLDNATICLTTDGWSNIRNDPIVNYMATSPLMSLYLESVSTGEQSHNADWISADIRRVIASLPNTTVSGVVTDNTSTNKSAWQQLSESHPSAYFQGCTSHGLHLLVKNISLQPKRKKLVMLRRLSLCTILSNIF